MPLFTVTGQGPSLPPLLVLPLAIMLVTACSGATATPDGGTPLSDGGFATQACTTLPSLVAGKTIGPATDPGSTCRLPVSKSALAAAQVKDLGHIKVGQQVNFTVPANTYAFSIVSQAISLDTNALSLSGSPVSNTVFPDLVALPNQQVVYNSNDDAEFVADPSALPISYPLSPPSPVTSVMAFPNTTAALQLTAADGGFPSGSWQFTMEDLAFICSTTKGCTGGNDAGVYDVNIVTRAGFPPAQGTLDLDVYLLTADGLTQNTAPSNANVQRTINTLSALYQSSGICIGTVTFFDVPDWVRTRYGTSLDADADAPCADLNQLYTLTLPNRNAIPIFFVESLTSETSDMEQEQVLGKDGTIPGPSTYGGTVFSGTVVSAADIASGSCAGGRNFNSCGADRVAYIAAHEIGHYLGLYHATEQAGTFFDPLTDTPQCQCQKCVSTTRRAQCTDINPNSSSPTQVLPADCAVSTAGSVCSGADNLMFWALDQSRAVGSLTSQQAAIARTNAAVQ